MAKITAHILKSIADEAFESLMETLHFGLYQDRDWVIINDSTPQQEFPLLITNEEVSPISRLLAQYRLSGKSVYDIALIPLLEKMAAEDFADEKIDIMFDCGRLWAVAEMCKALGHLDRGEVLKAWAQFSPYS